MADDRPIRIGDTVRLIASNRGFAVGAICTVKSIDIMASKVTIVNKKQYPCTCKIADVEIVSSPEWQLKLI